MTDQIIGDGVRHLAQDPDRTVFSLDPEAEQDAAGAVTIRLNPELGIYPENMLHAVLRMADPDVVHLPRLHCPSEADTVVEAAATGRLMLSGLPANDAPGAVLRLMDMGVPSYLVTGSLQMIVSCRTLQRLCDAMFAADGARPASAAGTGLRQEAGQSA